MVLAFEIAALLNFIVVTWLRQNKIFFCLTVEFFLQEAEISFAETQLSWTLPTKNFKGLQNCLLKIGEQQKPFIYT